MRSCPLNSPTVRGCQCSVKVESFSARLTGFIFALSYDIPNSWPVTPNVQAERPAPSRPAQACCSTPKGLSRLDHLVGPRQQRRRDRQAQCLGSLEVDDE